MNENIIKCTCCDRQIMQKPWSKELTAPFVGAVHDVGSQWICGDCAQELDENGMFPEEYAFVFQEQKTLRER